jgi:hypothetical protein
LRSKGWGKRICRHDCEDRAISGAIRTTEDLRAVDDRQQGIELDDAVEVAEKVYI